MFYRKYVQTKCALQVEFTVRIRFLSGSWWKYNFKVKDTTTNFLWPLLRFLERFWDSNESVCKGRTSYYALLKCENTCLEDFNFSAAVLQ